MAKKGYGTGSVTQLKNGTFELTVNLGCDAYGKRLKKRFYGATESECRRKHKEYLRSEESATPALGEYTLGRWLPKFLESYKKGKVQSSTYEEYQYIANKIASHRIGGMKLEDFKPIHINDFFDEPDISPLSKTVTHKLRFILNAAFESAIDNDYCTKNPVRRAAIPKKSGGTKQAFSDEAVGIITEYAKNDKEFGVPILLMFHGGLRSEEVRALQGKDLDFKRDCVHITKAIKDNGELGCPKNGKSRVVPLPKTISDGIRSLLDCSGEQYLVGKKNSYATKDGFRSRYYTFFKHLNRDKGLNIDPLTPHCTRHTYSTTLQRKGLPMPIVAALLGHSSVQVTQGYTHLDGFDDLKRAVDGMMSEQ